MSTLCFCDKSNTIRQFPENYLIAMKLHGEWVMIPDSAVSTETVLHCTTVIHENHSAKWGSGLNLLGMLTPYTIK